MDIREQIAEICMGHPLASSPYTKANQILAIKVGEDRVCARCCGVGNLTFNTEEGWHDRCPECSGTGKIPAKSIGECIEEV